MAGEQTTTAQGALPLSYTGTIPVAGFEPATSRVLGEVTLVFTTGRKVCSAGESAHATRAINAVREHAGTVGGFAPPRLAACEVSVTFTTDPVKLWLGE